MTSFTTQVAVRQDVSGRYEFATQTHKWSYEYTVSALGTRSEKRVGALQLDGKEIAGKVGDGVRTPWGLMQRFEAAYEVGWLLEGTYGHPIAPTGRVEVPAEAFHPNGEWHAVIMPWQYRLQTLAMGSRSETRSGRLFYERGDVTAQTEGSRVETPWGVMYWLGKPHEKPEIVPGDYEAGWLLRGTYDHAFDYEGPFIQPGEPTVTEGLVILESMYLADSKLGHGVAFSVPKKPTTHWHGALNIDPNVCQLNEFGDRTGCTKIAIRHYDVEVTQLRLADPLHLGRRIFRVDGNDLPAPITLIADARFQRFHLKTERELIPLFPLPPRR
jgi:hypothetical protein